MNALRLAAYPANATVADGVTLLVSAWFLVAGAAMLSDPTSVYTQRNVAKAPAAVQVAEVPQLAAVAVAPEAHFTIVVAAKRPANRLATRSDSLVSL